jgi:quercetin dioxygenase-like cupin family protein
MTTTLTTDHGHLLHRPSSSGLAFWGPGDSYRFLITGAESGGAYFAMEAIVPAGGGPPPHIHRNEDETFYVLEGEVEFLLGDRPVKGTAGDFVNVPRGTVHRFHKRQRGARPPDPHVHADGHREVLRRDAPARQGPRPAAARQHPAGRRRYAEAAPRYGIEFLG